MKPDPTCSAQVYIYVDAVVNHMCGSAAGSGTHSTCGSYFNSQAQDFPAVPYSSWDFNNGKCKTASGEIENYNDPYQVTPFIHVTSASFTSLLLDASFMLTSAMLKE